MPGDGLRGLDPADTERNLRAILGANAGTEYGRRHGFAEIQTIRDYQRRVPIVTYEGIRGEIAGGGDRRISTRQRTETLRARATRVL